MDQGLNIEERLDRLERIARGDPLAAAGLRPGTHVDGTVVTIAPRGAGVISQAETTSSVGPDGLPVRDSRPTPWPLRPRIRHILPDQRP
jgi:hypothetical protein